MVRGRRRNRRNQIHEVDKPIRHSTWSDWFFVDFLIEGFLLLVRGLAWFVSVIFKALS